MKKTSTIILLCFCSFVVYGQSSASTLWSGSPKYLTLNSGPKYPDIDTLKCHFLEMVNDSTFEWQSGYVIISRGFVKFGNTSVSENYLPITSGVVTSPLFYSDMHPIKNYAIKVVIKPINIK